MCISIDEFKGNTDAGKYQCILVDGKKNRVLDILPDRTQYHLATYFKSLDRAERHRVKFFLCDMATNENKKECDLMLQYNDDLRSAHRFKEWFYVICQNKKYTE